MFGFNIGGGKASANFGIDMGFKQSTMTHQSQEQMVALSKYNADIQMCNQRISELSMKVSSYEAERAMLIQYQAKFTKLEVDYKIKLDMSTKYELQIKTLNEEKAKTIKNSSKLVGTADVSKKEIAAKDKEISELKLKIKEWEAENNRDDAKIAELEKGLAMTQELLKKMQSSGQSDTTAITSQNAALNNLTIQLTKWRSEKEESDKLLADARLEIKNKDDQIVMLNQNIMIINTTLSETKNLSVNVNVQLQEKDSRYGNLKAEYDSLLLKYNSSCSDIERKTGLVAEYEKKIDVLMAQITSYIGNMEQLKVSSGSWEGKCMEMQNTIYNLNNQITILQKNFSTKDMEISHLNAMIELKDKRIVELSNEINLALDECAPY
jgi:chromosome segregation ATPase